VGEVVNLKRARKARARVAANADAEEQRFRFGQTRAAKRLAEARKRAEKALLDGAKLQDSGDESKPRE
jgi:hypothetical protein